MILDNIDIVFGYQTTKKAITKEEQQEEEQEEEKEEIGKRTSHAATDRILSALLVELDGCGKYSDVSSPSSSIGN